MQRKTYYSDKCLSNLVGGLWICCFKDWRDVNSYHFVECTGTHHFLDLLLPALILGMGHMPQLWTMPRKLFLQPIFFEWNLSKPNMTRLSRYSSYSWNNGGVSCGWTHMETKQRTFPNNSYKNHHRPTKAFHCDHVTHPRRDGVATHSCAKRDPTFLGVTNPPNPYVQNTHE